MSRLAASLLAAAVVAALAGCSGSSSSGSPHAQSGTSLAKYIAQARLAPCPASSSTPVSGGLPNVTLDCLGNGPSVDLAGLKGPAVVNIWGSWCVPCGQEANYLSSAYDADRGRVIFLGVDTEDDAKSALTYGMAVKPRVGYPSVEDPDKKVLVDLAKAPGPPETAFVGISGKVVHVHIGGYTSTAAVQADITTYLHVR